MKTLNVLAAIVASAGLAASVLGQPGNGTFVIEVRLVVDGDPNAPIGSGITSYAPGESATRVGLSLQARVTQTASGTNLGAGNYGIAGVGSKPSGLGGPAQFSHDDSAASGDPYVALRRGQTGTILGGDALPQAGFFGPEHNPMDMLGGAARRDFRGLGIPAGSTQDVNSLIGNATGATGSNAASSNGFITSSSISGLSSTIYLIVATDPIRYGVGQASPWYNLYRVYFDPNAANNFAARDVTVAFSGRIFAGVKTAFLATTGGRSISVGGIGGGQLDVTNLSATFRVGPIPAPAAGVVLGLGSLLAARRRRQV